MKQSTNNNGNKNTVCKTMKLGEMQKPLEKYYIVVEEWNYPCESGRNVVNDYDTLGEALKECEELCGDELRNYEVNCKIDALVPSHYINAHGEQGFIITPNNGLDDWYFACRAIEVASFDCMNN